MLNHNFSTIVYTSLISIYFSVGLLVVSINPLESYTIFGGLLHGFFALSNILCLWIKDCYLWAPYNTGSYYLTGYILGLLFFGVLCLVLFQLQRYNFNFKLLVNHVIDSVSLNKPINEAMRLSKGKGKY